MIDRSSLIGEIDPATLLFVAPALVEGALNSSGVMEVILLKYSLFPFTPFSTPPGDCDCHFVWFVKDGNCGACVDIAVVDADVGRDGNCSVDDGELMVGRVVADLLMSHKNKA